MPAFLRKRAARPAIRILGEPHEPAAVPAPTAGAGAAAGRPSAGDPDGRYSVYAMGIEGQVYYIGQANDLDRRLREHIYDATNERSQWLYRLMVEEGRRPQLQVQGRYATGAAAKAAEDQWIEHYRRLGHPLTNGPTQGERRAERAGGVAPGPQEYEAPLHPGPAPPAAPPPPRSLVPLAAAVPPARRSWGGWLTAGVAVLGLFVFAGLVLGLGGVILAWPRSGTGGVSGGPTDQALFIPPTVPPTAVAATNEPPVPPPVSGGAGQGSASPPPPGLVRDGDTPQAVADRLGVPLNHVPREVYTGQVVTPLDAPGSTEPSPPAPPVAPVEAATTRFGEATQPRAPVSTPPSHGGGEVPGVPPNPRGTRAVAAPPPEPPTASPPPETGGTRSAKTGEKTQRLHGGKKP
jgi:hypothetical protein